MLKTSGPPFQMCMMTRAPGRRQPARPRRTRSFAPRCGCWRTTCASWLPTAAPGKRRRRASRGAPPLGPHRRWGRPTRGNPRLVPLCWARCNCSNRCFPMVQARFVPEGLLVKSGNSFFCLIMVAEFLPFLIKPVARQKQGRPRPRQALLHQDLLPLLKNVRGDDGGDLFGNLLHLQKHRRPRKNARHDAPRETGGKQASRNGPRTPWNREWNRPICSVDFVLFSLSFLGGGWGGRACVGFFFLGAGGGPVRKSSGQAPMIEFPPVWRQTHLWSTARSLICSLEESMFLVFLGVTRPKRVATVKHGLLKHVTYCLSRDQLGSGPRFQPFLEVTVKHWDHFSST